MRQRYFLFRLTCFPVFQGSYLLAASNDFASRIWTVDDYRLRVSASSCPTAASHTLAVNPTASAD